MSRRPTVIASGIATVLAVAALLVAAASDHRATAFTLNVANNAPVASLVRGASLCQGPIPVTGTFSSLMLWARPAHRLEVVVRSMRGGTRLAARRVRTAPALDGAVTVTFARAIPRGALIRVCLRNLGRRRLAVEGGVPDPGSGALTIGAPRRPRRGLRGSAPRPARAIALLFLRPHPPTLLSLLPTVFARASLFKASWVGAWTFWVLAVALLLTFAVAGVAVATAVGAETSEPPS